MFYSFQTCPHIAFHLLLHNAYQHAHCMGRIVNVQFLQYVAHIDISVTRTKFVP